MAVRAAVGIAVTDRFKHTACSSNTCSRPGRGSISDRPCSFASTATWSSRRSARSRSQWLLVASVQRDGRRSRRLRDACASWSPRAAGRARLPSCRDCHRCVGRRKMRGIGFHGDVNSKQRWMSAMVSTRANPSGCVLRTHLHETARALSRRDQAILAQPAEGFAQHRAGDVEHIRKVRARRAASGPARSRHWRCAARVRHRPCRRANQRHRADAALQATQRDQSAS